MIASEGFADRITKRQLDQAQLYIDTYFPVYEWSSTIRNQIRTAYIEGGSTTLTSIIGEIENGKH